MYEISVIIPVRNTPADILIRGIEGFDNQSFSDFEIILVDDHSTDNATLDAIERLKKQYERINVIHLQEHMGAAGARNVGLEQAKGKYVIFADSDDRVNVDYLNSLYKAIVNDDSDVSVCGIMIFDEGNEGKVINRIRVGLDFDKYKMNDYLCRVTTSPCNKLCKKEYLINEGIRFQDLPSDNDTYYAIMTMLCTDKISYVDEELYEYRFNTSFQITQNRNPIYHLEAIKKARVEIKNKNHIDPWLDELSNVYFVLGGVNEMISCKDNQYVHDFYEEARKFIVNNNIIASHNRAAAYIDRWIKYEDSNNWLYLVSDYYTQLQEKMGYIQNEIFSTGEDIYVWGFGKRGIAFVNICKCYGVPIKAVYEQDDNKNYLIKEYGLSTVPIKEMINSAGIIIATTHAIYRHIKNVITTETTIVDLEELCPL